MAYSRSELLAIRETISVNEVRLSTSAWTNIRQAAISVCASTHRGARGGAKRRIHAHVNYTRRPRAYGQTAPNMGNLTVDLCHL